ncbi:hypothetical protein LguiA_026871 [Lonicera macranthoides]
MKNKISQASQHRRTPAPEEPNSGQTLSRRAAAPFYGHHNQHQKPVRLAMLCIAFSLFPLPWGSTDRSDPQIQNSHLYFVPKFLMPIIKAKL